MYRIYSTTRSFDYPTDTTIKIDGKDVKLSTLWAKQKEDKKFSFIPELNAPEKPLAEDFEAAVAGFEKSLNDVATLMKYSKAGSNKKLAFLRGCASRGARLFTNTDEETGKAIKVYGIKTVYFCPEAIKLFCEIAHSVGLYVQKSPSYVYLSGKVGIITDKIDFIEPTEQFKIAFDAS